MASRVYGYQGYKGYQFETSPKKIQPEYEPQTENKEVKKKNSQKSKKNTASYNEHTKKHEATKEDIRKKATFVAYIVFGFSILFTISYRDSIINEKFNHKEDLKAQLTEIQKVNEQLEVSVENELNLTAIENIAKEELGMSKLSNSQKIYVSLPKKEYVESKAEGIKTYEDKSLYKKIVDTISSFF